MSHIKGGDIEFRPWNIFWARQINLPSGLQNQEFFASSLDTFFSKALRIQSQAFASFAPMYHLIFLFLKLFFGFFNLKVFFLDPTSKGNRPDWFKPLSFKAGIYAASIVCIVPAKVGMSIYYRNFQEWQPTPEEDELALFFFFPRQWFQYEFTSAYSLHCTRVSPLY